ncbi:peptidoglycan DD-metalloendopeptidase family protein [Parasphingopyxis sp.]|uniref:M23 family metallopeptidase n=1 Tax=Parasphingopyxis sp. TaxID=1920299 RepID=UPI003FA144C6
MANAVVPSNSGTALLLRFTAIGLAIAYLSLAGLWLFPPWWTPYALGLAHILGTTIAARRLAGSERTRRRWLVAGEMGVCAIALAGMAALLFPAIAGRQAPADTVDLAAPLDSGRYLVVSGGTTPALNPHLMTLSGARFAAYRGQSHAVDIIGIDDWGFRAPGIGPRDPRRYSIYGARILAPCSGRVVGVSDGSPDMPVPEMDRSDMTGNHVRIACDGGIVVLAHMAPGSVRPAPGDDIESGAWIGNVGNSGNTNEPHLHIHVQRGSPDDMPIAGEPLWFTVGGRLLTRNDRLQIE